MGGGGEKKTLRLMAKHADIWHSFSDTATLERELGILAGHCADLGRDPAEIEISVMGKTEDRDKMYELGARLFTVHTGDPTELREFIAWRDPRNA
ncbi:hypothetical protein [Winogradskya consettensis]|uniref:hypothetical protein n=1 Tax=Winogradskya consettensis TaxID=113560 RepID=UPI0024546B63|nr:hypothetical protein [Actinoplanes consettensis]